MTEAHSTISMLNLESGSVIAGRYEVCERLGTGGMGIALKVIDRDLNDEVCALKLLHPHLAQDPEVYRRFRNEVLVARSLTHPNIVRIHDMGRTDIGFSYISMEFVDGLSLRDRITSKEQAAVDRKERKSTLNFDEALSIFCQIVVGVAYAHEKGVIHRDLKPGNVLFSKSGVVKIVDFGTARLTGDTTLTKTGQVIGTPDYMSPEQIQGESLDPRCDVYALGIIGYELIVGHPPFIADTAVAVAFKHLNEPIPHFKDSFKGVPKWYEDLVLKAAAKKKEDRFSTAGELLLALSEHVSNLQTQSGFYSLDSAFSGMSGGRMMSPAHFEDADYELGTGASTGKDDSWSIGKRDGIPWSTATDVKEKKFGGALRFLLLLIVLSAVIVGMPRADSRIASFYEHALTSVEDTSGFQLASLWQVFGISRESIPPEDGADVELVDREKLENELLGLSDKAKEMPSDRGSVSQTPTTDADVAKESSEKISETVEVSKVESVTKDQNDLAVAPVPPVAPGAPVAAVEPADVPPVVEKKEIVSAKPEAPKEEVVVTKVESVKAVDVPIEPKKEAVPERKAIPLEEPPAVVSRPDAGVAPVLPNVTEYDDRQADGSMEGDLPRARGFTTPSATQAAASNLQKSSLDLSERDMRELERKAEQAIEAPEQPLVPAQSYSGTVEVFTQGSIDGAQKALTLSLQESGGDIRGSAQVDGFGHFVVTGKRYPRGVEIQLQSGVAAFRFTGAERAGVLRGTSIMSGSTQPGKWEARLQ